MKYPCFLLAALGAAIPALPGQDMIAVSWSGQVYALDSASGASTQIGIGFYGQNAMARDPAGVLWSTAAVTGGRFLTRIDPVQGTVTAVYPTGDMRALAAGSGTILFGLAFGTPAGSLVRIDTATGVHTTIGSTGAALIQGMTMQNGVLYAWDLSAGLGTIDQTTGHFTDVNPAVGGGYIQWLATRPDGQLIGGGNTDLFAIDPVTGVRTLYAQTAPDLRGAEATALSFPYGSGCFGGSGLVTLTASGTLRAPSLLTIISNGHTITPLLTSTLAVLIVGGSRTNYLAQPLPLSLDPLLGTNGCSLYASIDATIPGGSIPATGGVQFVLGVPNGVRGLTFFAQCAAFDAVTGGMSWSNGLALHFE